MKVLAAIGENTFDDPEMTEEAQAVVSGLDFLYQAI